MEIICNITSCKETLAFIGESDLARYNIDPRLSQRQNLTAAIGAILDGHHEDSREFLGYDRNNLKQFKNGHNDASLIDDSGAVLGSITRTSSSNWEFRKQY